MFYIMLFIFLIVIWIIFYIPNRKRISRILEKIELEIDNSKEIDYLNALSNTENVELEINNLKIIDSLKEPNSFPDAETISNARKLMKEFNSIHSGNLNIENVQNENSLTPKNEMKLGSDVGLTATKNVVNYDAEIDSLKLMNQINEVLEHNSVETIKSFRNTNDKTITERKYNIYNFDDEDITTGDYRTWSQWQKLGRQVIKGSRAQFINGIPNFEKNQTTLRYGRNKLDYSGWLELGFQVKKGEKATIINGKPLFTRYQVVYKNREN